LIRISTDTLVKTNDSLLAPQEDRLVQASVLTILEIAGTHFGLPSIQLDDLVSIMKECAASFPLKCMEVENPDINRYVQHFQTHYHLPTVVDTESRIEIPEFEVICEPGFSTLREKLRSDLVNRWARYDPSRFRQKIQYLEQQLQAASTKGVIQFEMTSGIHRERQIADRIAQMIRQAKKHIYLMLAFYDEDVLFFADFLQAEVERNNADLRIIYSPMSNVNKRLILRLRDHLPQRDFFRAYSYSYMVSADGSKLPYVGNLHSKSLSTETELLVGSANVTAHALYHNVETALYTNDPKTVESANSFFLDIWKRLRRPDAI
jgi:phosphatidylserine/phosphatidylglycerophosphate/cardiolipin synthase-like enzyme